MSSSRVRLRFEEVIVIADLIQSGSSAADPFRRDLEQTDPSTLGNLLSAIERLGLRPRHYESPEILANQAHKHRGDIVLSIFGGATSRNRMALVPAICETMKLPYVGPDTYGRVVCQDKEISKALAAEAGLEVPVHRLCRGKSDLAKVAEFPLPYVAKPLLEGSSMGIDSSSLITDRRQGAETIARLLEHFQQPVLVEEFISGREVSFCFIESSSDYAASAFAEIVWNNNPNYFDSHLYDAAHKASAEGNRRVSVVDSELTSQDAAAMRRLISFVGHIGYGRIDGKLTNGKFVFLEITPDAWLGRSGSFASSLMSSGFSYEDIIEKILLSEAASLRDR